jgi:hypothetical protein
MGAGTRSARLWRDCFANTKDATSVPADDAADLRSEGDALSLAMGFGDKERGIRSALTFEVTGPQRRRRCSRSVQTSPAVVGPVDRRVRLVANLDKNAACRTERGR